MDSKEKVDATMGKISFKMRKLKSKKMRLFSSLKSKLYRDRGIQEGKD